MLFHLLDHLFSSYFPNIMYFNLLPFGPREYVRSRRNLMIRFLCACGTCPDFDFEITGTLPRSSKGGAPSTFESPPRIPLLVQKLMSRVVVGPWPPVKGNLGIIPALACTLLAGRYSFCLELLAVSGDGKRRVGFLATWS